MTDQSPPKRVTRARVAAKTTDIQTTKIATAASKAKATRTAPATKRQTRTNDVQDLDELTQPMPELDIPKTTRGRRAKTPIADPEPEQQIDEQPVRRLRKDAVAPDPMADTAPVKATRGRPKKVAVEAQAPEPVRTLRGRKKTDVVEEEPKAEPVKRQNRARTVILSKTATIPKKSVKFQEPDKENFVPLLTMAKGKKQAQDVETGLKAKPVRKPAVPRATRGRAKVEEPKSSPLSPKKATQVATSKVDHSDDELATTNKTPLKPLMKSPIKVPGSIFGTAKKLDFSTTITSNRVVSEDLGASIIGSPARRPPQSPFKDAMKASPQRNTLGDSMRRTPFKLFMPAHKPADDPSTFKASMLQSPARRPPSPTKVTEAGSPCKSNSTFAVTPKASTFKISRFTTPRAIPNSALRRGQMLPPPTVEKASLANFEISDAAIDSEQDVSKLAFSGRLSSILPREVDSGASPSESILEKNESSELIEEERGFESRVADYAIEVQDVIEVEDTIEVDDTIEVETESDNHSTPPCSPPQQPTTGAFSLREIDESPFSESDSEDELASASPKQSPISLSTFNISSHDFATSPATPTSFTASTRTPRTSANMRSLAKARAEKLGFTPLARQLSDWMAASPEKSEHEGSDSDEVLSPPRGAIPEDHPSPIKSTFFEDAMSVREEMEAIADSEDEREDDEETIHFGPVNLTEEDISLAFEADEMSLLGPEPIETDDEDMDVDVVEPTEKEEIASLSNVDDAMEEIEMPLPGMEGVHSEHPTMAEQLNIEHQFETVQEEFGLGVRESSVDSAVSEASQEYGDENDIPIDPELLPSLLPTSPMQYATPKRVLAERVFHTVSKVPLKAAADEISTRPSPIKRSASVSKVPTQRPSGNLSRSNTVISYSPSKKMLQEPHRDEDDTPMPDPYATPSKPDTDPWSAIATPARTPRRDLNTALLKGAVVFVDVHTTEGADASTLFTELLTHMGARCVKRWDWNGNSDEGGKIGITHVVFKDGGKRTLEKARETGGVVSCVGVGWVLDCERENKWLAEAPYSIDTTMIPRGGHRRRKSMEPQALAKLNASLALSTPGPSRPARKTMSPTKAAFSLPDTPFTSKSRRRDSVQWVHSPASSDGKDETLVLSPVPATPTPETVSAYGEDGLYGIDTPSAQTPYYLHKEQLVQKTAPPGKRYFDGEGGNGGFLTDKKDESVMMRLMAARRKSLQWAPKVGSPLARNGEW